MENPKFAKHAKRFVDMFDKAVEMLGPDIELLTDILLVLGAKHVGYGVKAEYYPSMGRALIGTMKELLADEFTDLVENSWIEMFGAISYDMSRAPQQKAHGLMSEPSPMRAYSDISAHSA
jgi:methyl-accepting chemotaxis protein/nitric oxide dioxygenase